MKYNDANYNIWRHQLTRVVPETAFFNFKNHKLHAERSDEKEEDIFTG